MSSSNSPSENVSHEYDVVIIGAGLAGLSAACTLLENGVQNIIILEADSEPGGRVRTVRFQNSFLDLGAQWLHGEEDNTLYQVAQQRKLLSPQKSTEAEGLFLTCDGVPIADPIVAEVDTIVSNLLDDCCTFKSSAVVEREPIPESVGHHLRQGFQLYLDKDTRSDERKLKQALFQWHLKYQAVDNACRSLEELCAQAWGEYRECAGAYCQNVRGGFSSIVESLIAQLPACVLRCSSPVRSVCWANSKVVIETRDQTCVAQQVIITCSIGVLQKEVTLFTPALPSPWKQALGKLGYGTINKIFLIYETPWWEGRFPGVQFVWLSEENSDNGEIWYKDITGFDPVWQHPGVLLGWIGGRGAELMEALDDDTIGRTCVQQLRKFMGKADIPLPAQIICTRWSSNAYVKGAYSYRKAPLDPVLQEPVCVAGENGELRSVLFFAGEAFHATQYATAHGAFASGRDQATACINARNKQAQRGR